MYLITGGTGFVGDAVLKELSKRGHPVIAPIRNLDPISNTVSNVEWRTIDEINGKSSWERVLIGVTSIIHCAARAHVLSDKATNPLEVYRRVNVEGTLNLARQAAQAGIIRFVFVSSIKVNGETTLPGCPFTADDIVNPHDPYGVSKKEAEEGLLELSAQTGMEVVIVRPPLVYGRRVKANFALLMRLVSKGVPMPLGCIHNARSMVALDNLVDFLITCLEHPAAAGQIFLVSDGKDVSTPELVCLIASLMEKKPLLLSVPVSWLEIGASLLGKRDKVQRLSGSLQVDIEKNRQILGWEPPFTMNQGLKQAVEGMYSETSL